MAARLIVKRRYYSLIMILQLQQLFAKLCSRHIIKSDFRRKKVSLFNIHNIKHNA